MRDQAKEMLCVATVVFYVCIPFLIIEAITKFTAWFYSR